MTDRLDLGIVPLVRGEGQLSAAFWHFQVCRCTHLRRGWTGVSVLDHGKRRGAYRVHAEADQIDLGNEPPLSVDGGTEAAWWIAAASPCSGSAAPF